MEIKDKEIERMKNLETCRTSWKSKKKKKKKKKEQKMEKFSAQRLIRKTHIRVVT